MTMTAAEIKLCDDRHKTLDKKLEEHDTFHDRHFEAVKDLEKEDVKHNQTIETICKGIERQNNRIRWLTTAIWTALVFVAAASLGFIIWFVQTIPDYLMQLQK